jgi:hypothetical protein
MSEIHFIGGEKGGVGKSVVARLLAQYWIDREQFWIGYDGDLSHGALLRHYSDYAIPLDIERLEELDRLIEQAATEPDGRLLVDLPAQSERHLHAWLESADVPALTAELEVGLRLWHVMDDGKDSLQLLERLLGRYGGQVGYVVVLNLGRGGDFELFERSGLADRLEALQAPVLQLRALHAPTMRKIDRLDKSYWGAIHNRGEPEDNLGLMERQRMKVWLKHAYGEFERAGI